MERRANAGEAFAGISVRHPTVHRPWPAPPPAPPAVPPRRQTRPREGPMRRSLKYPPRGGLEPPVPHPHPGPKRRIPPFAMLRRLPASRRWPFARTPQLRWPSAGRARRPAALAGRWSLNTPAPVPHPESARGSTNPEPVPRWRLRAREDTGPCPSGTAPWRHRGPSSSAPGGSPPIPAPQRRRLGMLLNPVIISWGRILNYGIGPVSIQLPGQKWGSDRIGRISRTCRTGRRLISGL